MLIQYESTNIMKKAWAIAPWDVREPLWEDIWRFDYDNNLISIGWSWLGNVITLDEDQIRERIRIRQPKDESTQPGYIIRQFRFLHKEIKPGHIILARKGLKQIAGLGVVPDAGDSYFDSTKAKQSNIPDYHHTNFLPVMWIRDFKPIEYKKAVFLLPAIAPFENREILKAVERYFKKEISDSKVSLQNSAICDIASAPIGSKVPDRAEIVGYRYQRDDRVRRFVIEQAKGVCEYCGKLGFLLPDGGHYLEAHHVIALSNQGSDTTDNVIALCPSDHREAHYGVKAVAIENKMIEIIKSRNRTKRDSV
jgi:5-methylcytosine-specific restriction endonuclease McrA